MLLFMYITLIHKGGNINMKKKLLSMALIGIMSLISLLPTSKVFADSHNNYYVKDSGSTLSLYNGYTHERITSFNSASTANALGPGYVTSGNRVKTAQVLLGEIVQNSIDVDGSYGPATRDAVKKFQKLAGIAQDGYVGPITWSKLIYWH
jgi:murein L,D-transpeptidase YcbB/YkuD